MSNVPSELKYSKSHEWVKLDGDIATVGITDHAQEELGDIVYVELPEVGEALPKLGPLLVDTGADCDASAVFGAVSMHPNVNKASRAVNREIVSNRVRIFLHPGRKSAVWRDDQSTTF